MDGKVWRLLLIMSMHSSMRGGTRQPAAPTEFTSSTTAGGFAVHGRTSPLRERRSGVRETIWEGGGRAACRHACRY